MRILAVGDFHGKIPRFLRRIINKEKPDLIISPGDFASHVLRKYFFKYVYGTDLPLWKFIGKRRVNAGEKKDLRAAKGVLKYLNKLKIPIISVTGNLDYTGLPEISMGPRRYRKDEFTPIVKKFKNISIIDFKGKKFKGYNFIGYPRSTFPGALTPAVLKKYPEDVKIARRYRKDYLRHKSKFERAIDKRKNLIFVSHNCPHRTKLDKIRDPKADKKARGQHYGSVLLKNLIKKWKPRLCICGHMHENQGKVKVSKTLVINPGAAMDKKCAIIDIKDKKIKVKFHK